MDLAYSIVIFVYLSTLKIHIYPKEDAECFTIISGDKKCKREKGALDKLEPREVENQQEALWDSCFCFCIVVLWAIRAHTY